MSLLWEFLTVLYAPLGAYGVLVEGTARPAPREARASAALVV